MPSEGGSLDAAGRRSPPKEAAVTSARTVRKAAVGKRLMYCRSSGGGCAVLLASNGAVSVCFCSISPGDQGVGRAPKDALGAVAVRAGVGVCLSLSCELHLQVLGTSPSPANSGLGTSPTSAAEHKVSGRRGLSKSQHLSTCTRSCNQHVERLVGHDEQNGNGMRASEMTCVARASVIERRYFLGSRRRLARTRWPSCARVEHTQRARRRHDRD